MADRRISTNTLTSIADAIREKTGKSAAMTPAEMATEIENISDGGWELIAEATTTEDVEAFRVDVPETKQRMAAYLVKYDCTFVGGAKYPCQRINAISKGSPYMPNTSHYTGTNGVAFAGSTGYKMLLPVGSSPGQNASPVSSVEYVSMQGYYNGDLVAAGSTIKVYGIGEPT